MTERRRLGKTNLQVSVIGIGGGAFTSPELIARAVDKGMNYLDTATCYSGSEELVGRAIGDQSSLREKLILATKWDPGVSTKREEMLASLEESLRRMRTDHVDVMQIHWLGGGHKVPDNGFNRLDNDELYRAMEEAKRAGKVLHFGATSHDGKRAPILKHAIDKGFEMILVKMNLLDYESASLPDLLAYARAHDVGVVVMKSQPAGGRVPPEYEKSRWSVFQANLRWVLAHPEVHCVVHSRVGFDPLAQDQAATAVQERFGLRDAELLEPYAVSLSPQYCRECATGCVEACPSKVAIPHLAHLAMYARDYGWVDYARDLYAQMPDSQRWSELCVSCHRCTEACPFEFEAAGEVRLARRLLG